MRRWVSITTLLLLGAGVGAQKQETADQRQRLIGTKQASRAVTVHADDLHRSAKMERGAAEQESAERQVVLARIRVTNAGVEAATARVAIIERRLAKERMRLGELQRPLARLIATLASLARRPAIAAIAQPGSVDDLVHVRAMLSTASPYISEHTQGMRALVAHTRRMQQEADMATAILKHRRDTLEQQRAELMVREAGHRMRATDYTRRALSASDRAIALREQARQMIDRMTAQGNAATTATQPALIPETVPGHADAAERVVPADVYRLPVHGRLVTGFGEKSEAGVRSRGLTFAAGAGSAVVAPASGVVRYARRFRDYGTIIIIDHGHGWVSLVTGLASVRAVRGATVMIGAPIGIVRGGDDPRVTVELRRHGKPVDIAGLIGG